MRGRPIFEGFNEKPEFFLDLFRALIIFF
jgi:hypothetical protein